MSIRELRFNVGGDPGDDTPYAETDPQPAIGKPSIKIFGTLGREEADGSGVFIPGARPANRMQMLVPLEATGGSWVYYQHGMKKFRIIFPPLEATEFQSEAGLPPQLPPEYSDPDMVALHYTPIINLPALELAGRFFRQNGQRFFLNGATGFNGTGRFVYEGPDALRPFLAQRQALGFNAIRLWSAYNIPLIGRVIPREIPDLYERVVPGLSALCAEYGQYPYWTGLTGPYSVTLGGQNEIVEHDRRMQDALSRVPYALYDRRNEFSKDVNQVGPLPALTLWTASQGSGQQDEDPPTPYGRFAARHPGSSEWQRKVGKQAWDSQNNLSSNIPWVDDETVRCEPGGETNHRHAHDAGACGALFIAGAFFHSAQAKLAVPFTGPNGELDTAAGWCEGVASIVAQGLDIAQDGQYTNHGDKLPDIIRIYEKRLGARSITLEIGA